MDTQSTLSQPSSETSELPGGSSSASSEVRALEDVAIVGMSCRTSGGVKTPEELWQFLLDKKNGSGTVPLFRWEPWLRRDSRNAKEIDKTIRKGYFIHDLENFDAAFFGISPKEAEQMDPHQRLGLELAWEALEHAGINGSAQTHEIKMVRDAVGNPVSCCTNAHPRLNVGNILHQQS